MAKRRSNIKAILTVSTASLLLFSALTSASSILANEGEWLMYRYDYHRTGNSPLTSNIVLPKVKWSFLTGGEAKSPPAVGDINNDGEFEVVFGSNDDHLYALDRFGNELWNFSALGDIVCSPTIGDVDGDGLNEIIFGGFYDWSGDPNLYVLNGEDGSLLWQFETEHLGGRHRGFQGSAILHDVNGDGVNDVLIGSMDYYFYAFNGPNGDIIWRSDVFEHFIRASCPLDDIDNDGNLEVVVAGNHAIIRAYDAVTGALEWENRIGYGVEATPVLADVDGDGFNEIILFTIGHKGFGISGDAVVLNHDGSELWRSDIHTYFYTSPTILDIDGDGLVDIIGGDSNDHTIIAYKGTDGTILWETVLPDSVWSQAPLVTSDIDGDGVIEVIAGANPNLYCLNTQNGTIEWTFETQEHIWGQPTIADLEKDGLAEVLFGCHDNYLYVLENALLPPVADAGEDQIVYEGDALDLDGCNSNDPDGTIEIYEWDIDDKDGLWWETGTLPDAIGQITTHIYGDNGVYTVTLRVTDNDGLTDTNVCNITVLNVNPEINIESTAMDVEFNIRVAGSKWSNVGLTLYEDDFEAGYLEVERWPGSSDDNPSYENPSLPTSLDLTKSYKVIVTYDPYPDNGDEIKGDQPNNGKDKKDNAGNPVWIIIRFEDGSEERIHHNFNTQQSKIRDSEHENHVEPWEVCLTSYLLGHHFVVTTHVTDPGSDDESYTYTYGSQVINIDHLNNPPNPDPYPSPEVNPVDIMETTTINYEGPGTITLSVEDDDSGIEVAAIDIN